MRYEFVLQKQDGPYLFEEIETQLRAQGALVQPDGSWVWPVTPSLECWVRRTQEGERCFHSLGLSLDSNAEKASQAFLALVSFAQSQGLQLVDAQLLKEATDKDEPAFLAQYVRLLEYADSYGNTVFAHKPSLTWQASSSTPHAPAQGIFANPIAKVLLVLLILAIFVFYKLAQKFLALPV